MNRMYLILFIYVIFGCKKEQPSSHITFNDPLKTKIVPLKENQLAIDSSLLDPQKNKNLKEFYQSIHYKTAWFSETNRTAILEALKKSREEGLNPSDYNIYALLEFEKNLDKLSPQDKAKYDILLTSSLQKYISHLTNGKTNPRKLYTNWDLKEYKIDITATTIELLHSDSLTKKIEQLKPNHAIYKSLKTALKIISALPKDNFKRIETTSIIMPKDSNSTVADIKKRLIYWKDLQPKEQLSLIYDTETIEAIKKFQIRHGLAADGIIGKATLASLNFSKQQRQEQIISNLERWRWFPRKMGEEYIIVNIPDYKLSLIKNHDTLRTHRVIVGRPKRKTPILSSKLTHVVFNPTWTVPPTIIREDLIPDALKNRNYFNKMNIKIYDTNGKIINPATWQLSQAKSYRYVQTPGTYNSLGMVKLIFPNRFSIYLHDTNHRDFFDKLDRSLSSGCVRVDNPLELTEYLLNDPINWNLQKITEALQNGKTKQVEISKKVSFHLLYWTAWSEKNILIYRDDIYTLDAALYKKLRN
jgi:murein L,D-transpeptidase YcbB/YkuD